MASLGPDPAKTVMPATSRHEGRPLMQREHLHRRYYLEPLPNSYAISIACSELMNRSSPTEINRQNWILFDNNFVQLRIDRNKASEDLGMR